MFTVSSFNVNWCRKDAQTINYKSGGLFYNVVADVFTLPLGDL
jgi:hypothetical protein